MYGTMESIHQTLQHLIEERNKLKSSEEVPNEENHLPISIASMDSFGSSSTLSIDRMSVIPTFTMTFLPRSKEEPAELSQSIPVEKEKSAMEIFPQVIKNEGMENCDMKFGSDFISDEIKDEDILNGEGINFGDRNSMISEQREESIDTTANTRANDSVENKGVGGERIDSIDETMLNGDLDDNIVGMDEISADQIDNDEAQTIDHDANIQKDSTETAVVERRRRSSRNLSKWVKCDDNMEESDEGDEPSMKKRKSGSAENRDKVVPQKIKSLSKAASHSKIVNMAIEENEKEVKKNKLECPECEFRSRSARLWRLHLKDEHSTTPKLAGCLLRCDCGNESYSEMHIHKCGISNFTVIRKGNRPIRRIAMTPKCVMCEMHPTTPSGYIYHLRIHHKTTLLKNGIYLLCSCGMRHTRDGDHKKHDKKCPGHEFTLHKLVQKVTLKCVLCEMHPKTPYGYARHLYDHHKTTLAENGIYLECGCGFHYTALNDYTKHDKKCAGRNFTLHKLD
ncbi:hypothetical protein PMAYCL1PPCAC_25270 [Pristionchus mayeri]|uniref:C2H2-type domain-containing protein n=1 Tax=Pristionchus mayeri TaxID=1317129 RepID=A0AAN5D3J3_9BILA|nr:hypothetical protein PMAYCL1PPCAC_25270 [Pristionchus mayeri]